MAEGWAVGLTSSFQLGGPGMFAAGQDAGVSLEAQETRCHPARAEGPVTCIDDFLPGFYLESSLFLL